MLETGAILNNATPRSLVQNDFEKEKICLFIIYLLLNPFIRL